MRALGNNKKVSISWALRDFRRLDPSWHFSVSPRLRGEMILQEMKKAFDVAKAANQFAWQQLFLFRCFLLCGLLFHWHGCVLLVERSPLSLEKLLELLRLLRGRTNYPNILGLRFLDVKKYSQKFQLI